MSAPALVLVLEVEAAPKLLSTAVSEAEQIRLEDALRNADDDVRELLEQVFALVERRAA